MNTERSMSGRSTRRGPFQIVGRAITSHLVAFLLFSPVVTAEEASRVLKGGWYPWDPYQYLLAKQDVKRLTGLDIQLVRAVWLRRATR